MKETNQIIIIGKIPPPIGGVTIHVKRLLDHLQKEKFTHEYRKLTRANLFSLIFRFYKKKHLIHLHTSSPFIRFLLSLLCMVHSNIKLIITFHGNIGRFNGFKNWLDKTSLRLCDIPVVLNSESLLIALKLNKKAKLITAFIPPVNEETLSTKITERINVFKKQYACLFCTNAFDVKFDPQKREIYCGSQLVSLFSKAGNNSFGFVFSDPSGNYQRYIKDRFSVISGNILFISEPHSFFEVLKHSDCFIRSTTTDGDPLSVKEALFLGKKVIASDCIKRPDGVPTFNCNNFSELQALLDCTDTHDFNHKTQMNNGAVQLMNLYNELTT